MKRKLVDNDNDSIRFWVILEQYHNVKNVLVIPLQAFAVTAIL